MLVYLTKGLAKKKIFRNHLHNLHKIHIFKSHEVVKSCEDQKQLFFLTYYDSTRKIPRNEITAHLPGV